MTGSGHAEPPVLRLRRRRENTLMNFYQAYFNMYLRMNLVLLGIQMLEDES